MSAIDRTDSLSTAEGPVSASAVTERFAGIGAYLTNGVFLYRVVGFVTGAAGEMVELEDCYWLDVVRVSMTDLRSRRLRLVTPAPLEG
jgi:hypothetical protein